MHLSDQEELIKRLSNNDKRVYEQLFKTYYVELCKFGVKYVRDETVAEEIVQELFINIWERRQKLKVTSSIKSYLYTAVRNRSFNYIKLQLPQEHKKIDIDDMKLTIVEDESQEMQLTELRKYVQLAINQLPPKCQLIFNLSKNAGMTYKEIAEELNVSVKTVENQVGLALKKLREKLNPIWDKIMILLLMYLM